MNFPFETLSFGTILNYSPKTKGLEQLSVSSRLISDKLKTANPPLITQICERLSEEQCREFVEKFLNKNTVLVPIPGSSKLVENAVWPSREIANGLFIHGFGNRVLPLIERQTTIRSSHKSGNNRPTVKEHLATFRVNPDLFKPISITLIDDVVTRGSTAYACFLKLKEVYPDVPISLFSVMRTQGFIDNIEKLFELIEGNISYDGIKPDRIP